jgi:hypothetical protein
MRCKAGKEANELGCVCDGTQANNQQPKRAPGGSFVRCSAIPFALRPSSFRFFVFAAAPLFPRACCCAASL